MPYQTCIWEGKKKKSCRSSLALSHLAHWLVVPVQGRTASVTGITEIKWISFTFGQTASIRIDRWRMAWLQVWSSHRSGIEGNLSNPPISGLEAFEADRSPSVVGSNTSPLSLIIVVDMHSSQTRSLSPSVLLITLISVFAHTRSSLFECWLRVIFISC